MLGRDTLGPALVGMRDRGSDTRFQVRCQWPTPAKNLAEMSRMQSNSWRKFVDGHLTPSDFGP